MNLLYKLFTGAYHRLRKIKTKKYLRLLISRGLSIGEGCEIVDIESVFFDPSHCYLISIGRKCTLAPNVRFIAHDASTKPFLDCSKFAKIEVKDNCFIGDSVTILPGVTIGPNAILASAAVVTTDVPPNTVAAGNPARVITSLEEYLKKTEAIKKRKKVFGEDYYIEHLTEKKRKELIASIGHDFGLMV